MTVNPKQIHRRDGYPDGILVLVTEDEIDEIVAMCNDALVLIRYADDRIEEDLEDIEYLMRLKKKWLRYAKEFRTARRLEEGGLHEQAG